MLGKDLEHRLRGRVADAQGGAVRFAFRGHAAAGGIGRRRDGAERGSGAQAAHPVEVGRRCEHEALAAEQGAAIHLADQEVEALLARDAATAEPVHRRLHLRGIPARVHVGGPRLAQVLQAVPRRVLHDAPEVERLVVRDEVVVEEHAGRVVLDAA